MSWVADCAFDEFAKQFSENGFASAHQYRDRHGTAAAGQMTQVVSEFMGALKRTLGR